MSSDLLFRLPPGTPDLLFGEVENLPDSEATVTGTLPGFRGAVSVGYRFPVSIVGALPSFSGAVQARYVSDTDRPLVSKVGASHQDAAALQAGSQSLYERAEATEVGPQTSWGAAGALRTDLTASHQDADRTSRASLHARHQDADRVPPAGAVARHQDALRDRRLQRTGRYQEAVGAGAIRGTDWQDRYRDRRPGRQAWWTRAHRRLVSRADDYGPAAALDAAWLLRHQDAMRPPAGTSVPPIVVPPPFEPCYLPNADLVFDALATGSAALVFRCETHADPEVPATVIVPVRSVYIMNNAVTLHRVSDGMQIPVKDVTLAIDADSWTWSWSARLRYEAAPLLRPSGPDPVEVLVTLNGVGYRLIVERLATDRSFGDYVLRVSGRGRNAVLADPYAPRRFFSSATDRTAQQLMLDALTENSVSLGWGVDFGLEDWLVPGGTWAHQGSWLTAVRTIAEAAGGYLQPHRTDAMLRVLPRYPAAPWAWGSLTPDFELPAQVTAQEAIELVDKPSYNRVFVSGERNGRLVRVTRVSTAGDQVAPTVVDPLVTAAAAGRQRGLAVLSDGGRQEAVQLRLPVLSETGVITPGSLVRYLDGTTTRLGLVRTTSVSGGVQLRQTLGIETHVAP